MPTTQLLQQLHALPAAARRPPPRRARACRRSSRACRCPPAPGSRAARSSRAAPGWRSPSTAPRSSRSQAFEEGIAHAATNGTHPRLDLLRRRHRLAERAGADRRPAVRGLRPTLALAPSEGTAFSEDTEPALAPRRRAARDAARRGQGLASSRRSATRARTSRTSPRATSTRSASSTIGARTGWLGRYIDRTGDDDNPLQGLSLDGSLSPMLATATCRSPRSTTVDGLRHVDARHRRPGRAADVRQLRQLRRARAPDSTGA